MLNQCVIVGRINSKISVKEYANNSKVVRFEVLCTSPSNEEEYIPVEMDGDIINNYKDLIKGGLVGVKGRLKSRKEKVYLQAERITYLQSRFGGEYEN